MVWSRCNDKVTSQDEQMSAEQVAIKVSGVKPVKNLPQVVPRAAREIVERDDAAINVSVDAAFNANHRITDSAITVASLNRSAVVWRERRSRSKPRSSLARSRAR
jgi:hypothetical protein